MRDLIGVQDGICGRCLEEKRLAANGQFDDYRVIVGRGNLRLWWARESLTCSCRGFVDDSARSRQGYLQVVLGLRSKLSVCCRVIRSYLGASPDLSAGTSAILDRCDLRRDGAATGNQSVSTSSWSTWAIFWADPGRRR